MKNQKAAWLRCNAKLNLSLDITGVLPNGYHELDTVMQSVNLYDKLSVVLTGGDEIKIRSNLRYLPSDGRNLVYKAAALLAERYGVKERGISVQLEKRIPSQAGLGGGSADAAGALIALNRLWNLFATGRELAGIGLEIGADLPFCLSGGTARARGIGEKLTPLPPFPNCRFLIAMPPSGAKTRDTFQKIDACSGYRRPDTETLAERITAGSLRLAAAEMVNVFETAGLSETAPPLLLLMRENGALGASLTGTGAAVFGVFEEESQARRCGVLLRQSGGSKNPVRTFIARPVGCGVYF